MLRAIREIQPRFVVGENVRGITNWNGGMVFDQVQADLEVEGFEVLPLLLPACAVNAPHRRDRIWFVAHAKDANAQRGGESNNQERQSNPKIGTGLRNESGGDGQCGTYANPSCAGREAEREQPKSATQDQRISDSGGRWERFPTQSPVCGGDDGLPRELDGITFSKWRKESIMAYGNAIVPQVAYQIFKAINQTNG